MKYYLKNHLGIYKEIKKSTYEEVFKINSSLLMIKIFGELKQ